MARAFTRPVDEKLAPETLGRYFENTVGARFIEAGWNVFYWKKAAAEVDFIVHGPRDQKYAIEVKSSSTTFKELTSLKAFCQEHKDYELCLISLTDQVVPSIKTLPVEWALSLGS